MENLKNFAETKNEFDQVEFIETYQVFASLCKKFQSLNP